MNDLTLAVAEAFKLIASLDAELRGIVILSLEISLTAVVIA